MIYLFCYDMSSGDIVILRKVAKIAARLSSNAEKINRWKWWTHANKHFVIICYHLKRHGFICKINHYVFITKFGCFHFGYAFTWKFWHFFVIISGRFDSLKNVQNGRNFQTFDQTFQKKSALTIRMLSFHNQIFFGHSYYLGIQKVWAIFCPFFFWKTRFGHFKNVQNRK